MFNFFKNIFGPAGPNDPPNNFNSREHFLKEDDDQFASKGFFSEQDDQMGFNVFSNPLEMHRYFESQLNSMLKSFGIPGDGSFFGFNETTPDAFSSYLEAPEQAPPNGDLRDQFLKPDFQQPHTSIEDRSDNDLDGKFNKADLDSMLSEKKQQLQPYVEKPRIHSFGKQIMTKMFTNHNGMVESRQTIRDNQGNEETVVTHKKGDKEYTKITKTDRNGRQEIKENFINMTEDDLKTFFAGTNGNMIMDSPPDTQRRHPNWFPFEKYFK